MFLVAILKKYYVITINIGYPELFIPSTRDFFDRIYRINMIIYPVYPVNPAKRDELIMLFDCHKITVS